MGRGFSRGLRPHTPACADARSQPMEDCYISGGSAPYGISTIFTLLIGVKSRPALGRIQSNVRSAYCRTPAMQPFLSIARHGLRRENQPSQSSPHAIGRVVMGTAIPGRDAQLGSPGNKSTATQLRYGYRGPYTLNDDPGGDSSEFTVKYAACLDVQITDYSSARSHTSA